VKWRNNGVWNHGVNNGKSAAMGKRGINNENKIMKENGENNENQ
jgi:hypothetical protein